MLESKIRNSQGKLIVLSDKEERIVNHLGVQLNALGYDIDLTSLTAVQKTVLDQKFFEVAPADYLPVRVGNGAWNSQLLTYRSFAVGGDFDQGVINTGGANGRLASGDVGIDSVTVQIKNWAKEINWTLFDLQQASQAGNWDLVIAKEKQRKKNWDLGIQKVAFLGMTGDSSVQGLLNLSGVTNNTSLITQSLSSMSAAQITAFVAGVLGAYRANANKTAWPTHFYIPESDYLGLGAMIDPAFPIKTKLAYLEESFKLLSTKPGFKILPLVYGDSAYNNISSTRYVLMNYDEDSIRMEIPVDYTNTLANSINNFSFQNVGYAQFTGVMPYRPLEILYFSY